MGYGMLHVALALGIGTGDPDLASARTTQVDDVRTGTEDPGAARWEAFAAAREEGLRTLAQPLLACAQPAKHRRPRPPECGSPTVMVQAAAGLALLYNLTAEPHMLTAARRLMTSRGFPTADDLDLEGASWMLLLAREQERWPTKGLKGSTGEQVADRVEAYLRGQEDGAFARGMMFGGVDNVAWPLMQLWSWADYAGDDARLTRLQLVTQERLLGQVEDSWCPWPVDSTPEPFEFLPPCLQRAMTVLTVMPTSMTNPWLAEFVAAQTQLAPLRGRQDTRAKLNFSRGWTLWSIFQATGSLQYRDLYVAHVQAQLDELARDAASGVAIAPDVAAFGVYALSQSSQ